MADSNKTENATPRRRQQAREKGQLTRSRELSAALSFITAGAVLAIALRGAAPHWTDFYRRMLYLAGEESVEPNGPILFWTSLEAFRWTVPIMVPALLVSLASGFAQGGFVFAPSALTPSFDRINPASHLKQMVSLAAVSNILKSILPFAVIAWAGYACIRSHWYQILACSYGTSRSFASLLGGMAWEICWKSGLVMLAWSGIDYMLLRWKSEGDMKMSRQEIKEEHKQTDGSPENKMRIRKLQRQARRKQMIKATETATIVITNPTHYAVALRYEPSMPAPLVVAKGLDLLAAKIKEIALERDIPIMENKPLAQALYKGVEVGEAIPSALYQAVAELLVLVYRAQAELKQREAQRKAAAQSSSSAGTNISAGGMRPL
jgi:flagellar biosynthesis protein FlhB